MADLFAEPTIDDTDVDDVDVDYGDHDESEADTQETRSAEDAQSEPSRAMVRSGQYPDPIVQLVGIYDFNGKLKVRKVVNGQPIEPFRDPSPEEAAVVLSQGVRSLNTTGMAGIDEPKPFYKRPLFVGLGLLAAAGAAYYGYQEYVKPMLEDEDDAGNDADDDDDEE